jgi:hypothetical protein
VAGQLPGDREGDEKRLVFRRARKASARPGTARRLRSAAMTSWCRGSGPWVIRCRVMWRLPRRNRVTLADTTATGAVVGRAGAGERRVDKRGAPHDLGEGLTRLLRGTGFS